MKLDESLILVRKYLMGEITLEKYFIELKKIIKKLSE